jgi:hypothetical protein
MKFGAFLHDMSRRRTAMTVCVLVSAFFAVWSVANISLLPPGVSSRSMTIAGASTHVLIDTPHSQITDLRVGEANYQEMTSRADLLGNVMESQPVRDDIGHLAGIDPNRIAVTVPITANVPRFITEPGSEQRVTALIASTNQYRLDIAANPDVPVLDIYSQAPNAAAAQRLANDAVAGLRQYLDTLYVQQGIPAPDRVQLLQFGQATGRVINGGVQIEIAVLTFFTVLGICLGATAVIVRMRRGWELAGRRASPQAQA